MAGLSCSFCRYPIIALSTDLDRVVRRGTCGRFHTCSWPCLSGLPGFADKGRFHWRRLSSKTRPCRGPTTLVLARHGRLQNGTIRLPKDTAHFDIPHVSCRGSASNWHGPYTFQARTWCISLSSIVATQYVGDGRRLIDAKSSKMLDSSDWHLSHWRSCSSQASIVGIIPSNPL